jgi:hypothetical protein
MARLGSRGRTELVRVSKEKTFPEYRESCGVCNSTGKYLKDLSNADGSYVFAHAGDECATCRGTGKEKNLTTWERTTIALMSDGKILEKRDVQFRSDGQKHSYGWKIRPRTKKDMTVEAFVAACEKAGYSQEKTRV